MTEKIIKLGVHDSGSKECPMTFFYLAATENMIDPRGLPTPPSSLAAKEEWPGHYVVRHSATQLVLGFPDGNAEALLRYASKLSDHLGGLAVDTTIYGVQSEADFGLEAISFAPGFGCTPETTEVA